MRKPQLLLFILFFTFPAWVDAAASVACSTGTEACQNPDAETSTLAPMGHADKAAAIKSPYDSQAPKINSHDSELFSQPKKINAVADPYSSDDSQRLKTDPHP